MTRMKKTGMQSRVLVLMFNTPDVQDYASISAQINQRYAERHGYEFTHHVYDDFECGPHWQKIRVAIDALDDYDYVFWIDSDAAVYRQHKPLPLDFEKDVIFSSDRGNGQSIANSGVFLVRSSEASRHILERWYDLRSDSRFQSHPFDQLALDSLLVERPDCVEVRPTEEINSLYKNVMLGQFHQNFVVHLMATTRQYRIEQLARIREITELVYDRDDAVFCWARDLTMSRQNGILQVRLPGGDLSLTLQGQSEFVFDQFSESISIARLCERIAERNELDYTQAFDRSNGLIKKLLFDGYIVESA